MAEREQIAVDRFVAYAIEHAGLDRAGALRSFEAYRKAKVLKLDRVTGAFQVKHGALLDAEVLRNAARISS